MELHNREWREQEGHNRQIDEAIHTLRQEIGKSLMVAKRSLTGRQVCLFEICHQPEWRWNILQDKSDCAECAARQDDRVV